MIIVYSRIKVTIIYRKTMVEMDGYKNDEK